MPPTDPYPAEILRRAGQALSFDATPPEQRAGWSDRVRDKLRHLLRLDLLASLQGGHLPAGHVIRREACDGFVREKVDIDNGALGVIPAYVLTPDPLPAPAPAVLCLHGHGGYHAGKDMVAGVIDTHPIAIECAEALNYGYGVQLARQGFVTLCPDAYGFGERMLADERWTTEHLCSRYDQRIQQLGFSHQGVTTASNQRVIDYAQTLLQVRKGPVGCVGLSYGGMQALVLTAADTRVAAAVISGSLSRQAKSESLLHPELANEHCGAQHLAGMLAWFDRPDLAISIAPRPLLFEFMTQDSSLDFKHAWACFEYVREGYEALSVGDRLEHDLADTEHRYIGDRPPTFLRQWL